MAPSDIAWAEKGIVQNVVAMALRRSVALFEIAQLWIYPVKSLGGMRVQSAEVTEAGSLLWDREWLVVREDGRMLWQGDLPRMTLLQATVDGESLIISERNGAAIAVPVAHGGVAMTVTQYGATFDGVDAGDEIAAWLSAFLDFPCRLVRIGVQAHRWKLNPLHLVSVHSLAVLNQRLAALRNVAIEVERLRPNVVLAGTHEPFAEETVSVLDFGGAEIRLNEPCVRCELPNISRVDASRQKQPLKLIGGMSKERPASKPASFGVYSRAVGPRLVVGMSTAKPAPQRARFT